MSFNERRIWLMKTVFDKEYLTGCRATSFPSYVLKSLQTSKLVISFLYSSWFPLCKILNNCFVLLFPPQFLVPVAAVPSSFPLLIQHKSFCPLQCLRFSLISLFLLYISVFRTLLDLSAFHVTSFGVCPPYNITFLPCTYIFWKDSFYYTFFTSSSSTEFSKNLVSFWIKLLIFRFLGFMSMSYLKRNYVLLFRCLS